jgi:hypothetical protein
MFEDAPRGERLSILLLSQCGLIGALLKQQNRPFSNTAKVTRQG